MFWTIGEAATFLKMKNNQVYYLASEGKLAAILFGDRWKIAPGDIENYTKQLPISGDCQQAIIESLPAIITVQDLVALFKADRRTVTDLIYLKDIPAWKAEKRWNIARCDLMEYCLKASNVWG